MLVLYADGIGSAALPDDSDESILGVAARDVAARVGGEAVRIPWPASMAGVGGPLSWERAAEIGVAALDEFVDARPGVPVVLLGYSGGCRVIHDWLDGATHAHGRVKAVGLLSDPFRPAARWQHGTGDPGGSGICGERLGPLPDRTFWSSAPGDAISSCVPDSPLRTLADLSDKVPGSLLRDLRGHLGRGDWQLANYMKLWRRDPLGYLLGLGPRMVRARADVRGYLTGAHTTAYVVPFDGGPSLRDRLAATVAWKASRP